MKFHDEASAREFALHQLIGKLSQTQAPQRLAEYERNAESAADENESADWASEADALREWIDSDEFQRGEYSEGLDREFLELIEWRAQAHAFVNGPSEGDPFTRTEFFTRWMVGANYALFSILGKLTHNKKGDNSLVRLWQSTLPFIRKSNKFSRGELRALARLVSGPKSHFRKSPALAVRHKTISHNVAQPRIDWSDVDRDIRVLSRTWSILAIWCEAPVLFPFRQSSEVFRGIEDSISQETLTEIRRRRDEYIESVKSWCHAEFETGKTGEGSPFASMRVNVAVAPQTTS